MDAARLLEAGAAHLEAGRLDEAAALINQACALAPHDAQVRYRLGLLAGDRGDIARALAEFDAAIALDPGYARAHNNRGSMLVRMGRDAEAEAAFRVAIDLDSALAPPRLNLGHALARARKPDAAAGVYREAIALGIEPEVFAHHLAALTGAHPARAADTWVRATFDNFAPAFESQLQDVLGYRVPQDLAALLAARAPAGLDILDLGCGTGLAGAALAGWARSLKGVDLSPRMLLHARERGIYAALECAEVHAYLAGTPAAAFDAIVAADVFIYIGALEALFAEARRVLRPGGWFAFSAEEEQTGDFTLRASGRYAQSHGYILRLAHPGFTVQADTPATIRFENGAALAGRLYVLRRTD